MRENTATPRKTCDIAVESCAIFYGALIEDAPECLVYGGYLK